MSIKENPTGSLAKKLFFKEDTVGESVNTNSDSNSLLVNGLHLRELIEHLFDGVYILDRNRGIIYWNRAAEHITGFSKREVIGSKCHDKILGHVDEKGTPLCDATTCPAMKAMRTGEIVEDQIYLHHKDGYRLPVTTRIIPIRDSAGEVTGAIEIFHDNSPMVEAQSEIALLENMSSLDSLTEIGNRRFLETHIRSKLRDLQQYKMNFGVLFCDIDQFKQVNDTQGHQVGDKVIKIVARTLTKCIRPGDFVGRWGGEEFMIILPQVKHWQMLAIAERLRAIVRESRIRESGSNPSNVTVSIGGTMARDGDDLDSLYVRVDRLMYVSKRAGGNKITMDPQQ